MGKKILVIGGGTAGASAAFSAKKTDRTAEITVFNQESYPTYSRCGLPFAIQGIITPVKNLVVFPFNVFQTQKINYLPDTQIKEISPNTKTVVTEKGDKHSFDTLVIATGSYPVKPPIEGVNQPFVFTIRTMDDAKKVIEFTNPSNKSAVVIGASFIGLEMAEALQVKGWDVTVIEAVKTMWRTVDEEVGEMVNQHLIANGVKIIEESLAEKINQNSVSVRNLKTKELVDIPSGLVIISAGVRTDIEIAKKAGLAIGSTGGIKVNAMLESSVAGIYSAGDCAESVSAITKEPITSGLGTIAARQGVVAGANAAGADMKAPPIINAFILSLFHKEIGSAGLTESYIKKNPALGFTPVSTLLKYPSLPHYYPGGEYIYTKLIADSLTNRILGGQIIGSSGIGSRVNMLSLLIESKATVEQVIHADFCYSPPCSDTWDPLSIVAQGLLRKTKR